MKNDKLRRTVKFLAKAIWKSLSQPLHYHSSIRNEHKSELKIESIEHNINEFKQFLQEKEEYIQTQKEKLEQNIEEIIKKFIIDVKYPTKEQKDVKRSKLKLRSSTN